MDDLAKVETEVKLDAEALLKHIEDFFEHLFKHTPATAHQAIVDAQIAVTAAVNPIPPAAPVVVASGAPAVEPRINLTESAS